MGALGDASVLAMGAPRESGIPPRAISAQSAFSKLGKGAQIGEDTCQSSRPRLKANSHAFGVQTARGPYPASLSPAAMHGDLSEPMPDLARRSVGRSWASKLRGFPAIAARNRRPSFFV